MSSTPWSSRENPSPADQLHHFSYLRTASDRSIVGLTATQLRDELSVYSKAEVDSLLAGKAHSNHSHAFSVYSGSAGDPAHQHLVQGTTGIEQ